MESKQGQNPTPVIDQSQIIKIEDLQQIIGELVVKNMMLEKENARLRRQIAQQG